MVKIKAGACDEQRWLKDEQVRRAVASFGGKQSGTPFECQFGYEFPSGIPNFRLAMCEPTYM